jgi:hypothetical protein
MTLRRALIGLTMCYPATMLAFWAGIFVSDRYPVAKLVLLGFYSLLLFSLKSIHGLADRPARHWFGVALVLAALHAAMALLCSLGPRQAIELLVTPLLLGILPIVTLVGLASARLATGLGHRLLGWLFVAASLGWVPVSMLVGVATWGMSFVSLALLTGVLAWVAGRDSSIEEEDSGIGFSRPS